MTRIPVIDLFAGPGGLGEGFSSYTDKNGNQVFDIALSIEKDLYAHSTLELRSFFRKFPKGKAPEEYYEYIRKKSLTRSVKQQHKLRSELFDRYPDEARQAQQEAWLAELGKSKELHDRIDSRIKAITGNHLTPCWGVIGGPPCQAYSVIGRSRNKGKIGYSSESDERTYLYQQYLRIIARHKPDFFLMENVRGMLSAKLNGKSLFQKILEDLRHPGRHGAFPHNTAADLEYHIYPLATNASAPEKSSDYIISAENYGIPQARHRVILLGIKKDFSEEKPGLLIQKKQVNIQDVLDGLPRLRSGLSREKKINNNFAKWAETLCGIIDQEWFNLEKYKHLSDSIITILESIFNNELNQGSEFVPYGKTKRKKFKDNELTKWYLDKKLKGVCNHSSRSHMVSDLYRYLYASSFAAKNNRSPLLEEFPVELIPAHKNASSGHFNDRFRVQVATKPSTTVTSHISKDGHYFIHYDPAQCRSLTVREAARLQTFPDNYFFEGSRTQQYIQVGNAVPPLLARQIAEIVHELIQRTLNKL